MSEPTPKTQPLARWPVLVALGLVAALIVGMVGLDLYFSEQESLQTTDIIENSQRSIVLLNEIRADVQRLVAARAPRTFENWQQRLVEDSRRYDPMATYKGERDEWNHVKNLLRQLPTDGTGGEGAGLAIEEAIDKSIDRLVAINSAAGHGNLAAIRAAHMQAIWSDVTVGGLVLGIATVIAGWLMLVLGRQRRLVVRQVQLLDEKNAELEAFAGRAAHDLRSPMNPIRGYADLILEAPSLPENVAAMAQRIRRAVDRMTRVVDDMLALSVAGRPPEGRSACPAVVARVLEEMGAELQGVEVVTRVEAGQVACAEGVLSQILRNLIGNALKFRAPARPLHIAIETRDVGVMVEIVVQDNGVGMDAESAQRAFEPFYRGSHDRGTPGHGLGLAIIERTTHALGGTCELSSILDQGTRVVVQLPRA
jgi:signal transduction histidine kinase